MFAAIGESDELVDYVPGELFLLFGEACGFESSNHEGFLATAEDGA